MFPISVFAVEDVDWKQDTTLKLQEIDLKLKKSFVRGEDYQTGYVQGFVVSDKYIVFDNWISNDDNDVLTVVDKKSLEIVSTYHERNFGHANDLVYNSLTDEYFVIDSSRSKMLIKFKINSSHQIVDLEDVSVSRSYSSMAYDFDDDYYIGYAGKVMYVMDHDFKDLYSFPVSTPLVTQGLSYSNGNVYFSCYEDGKENSYQTVSYNSHEPQSNLVYRYDMKGNLRSTLYLSNTLAKGEIESLTVDKDRSFLAAYNITLDGKRTISIYQSDFLKSVKEVELTTLPQKLTYIQNEETLDIGDGVLRVTYADDSSEVVALSSEDVSVSGFDTTKLGKQAITIQYSGKQVTFEVEVVKKVEKETQKEEFENPKTGSSYIFIVLVMMVVSFCIFYFYQNKFLSIRK